MKLGLVARADNRGLGLQTWDLYRHLKPAATLLVRSWNISPYAEHLGRYPGAILCDYEDGGLDFGAMEEFVRSVDVILTCETPYDYRLFDLAREYGVATVVQGNLEFLAWLTQPTLQRPDLFLAPSTWELDRWPAPTVHLPFPVDTEKFPPALRYQAKSFLHVAGHKAMRDRAGSRFVLAALRHVRAPNVEVTVRSQSRMGTAGKPEHVKIIDGDIEDHRDLYLGADVLLAPRRYGGQSLPLNEAMSLGMPVIALNREPERSILMPESLVPARVQTRSRCQAGELEIWGTDPRHLAKVIDRFATDPGLVVRASDWSIQQAERISWKKLLPRYRKVFEGLLQGEVLAP